MPAPRFGALLLDLDGTLLDVEISSFVEAFLSLAAARFGGPADEPRIVRAMGAAARAMALAADGARTLDHIFLETFAPAVDLAPEQVRAVLEDFYRGEF
jgi:beta-phosphoglucomutase-like phosphatase (HAD superfamily)